MLDITNAKRVKTSDIAIEAIIIKKIIALLQPDLLTRLSNNYLYSFLNKNLNIFFYFDFANATILSTVLGPLYSPIIFLPINFLRVGKPWIFSLAIISLAPFAF